jgi:hypothetical protein
VGQPVVRSQVGIASDHQPTTFQAHHQHPLFPFVCGLYCRLVYGGSLRCA